MKRQSVLVMLVVFVMAVTNIASANILIIQPGDIYGSVSVPSTLTVEMIGGEVGTFDIDGGIVNVRGGIINGSSIRVYSGSTFNMYGGRNNGVGEIGSYGGTINILGGEAGVVMNGWGGGTVNIRGGEWEDFIYAYGGLVNIYGYSLDFNQSGGKYGNGLLTGFWQDGIPFSLNYVDVEPDNLTHQHVVLHDVPPPIANAGGPYFLDIGDPPIILGGSVLGGYSQAAWDLNLDGLFDDAFGLSPLISSNMLTSWGFSPGMTWDIGLQVTGLYGGVDISTTELTLTPVPSAVILGSIGLTFTGWLLRRRKML